MLTTNPTDNQASRRTQWYAVVAEYAQNWWLQYPRWLRRTITGLVAIALATALGMYSIGEWYIWTNRHQPTVLGTSFIADYATSLGLDPHQTLLALLDDLQVRHVRFVSYWRDIEPQPGQYDFSELDWEFQQADAHQATVSLAIGLRQPRWPECHTPNWVLSEPVATWQPQLEQFMTAVINRYRANPALISYQLENEYFLKSFGTCQDDNRQRLIDETKLARSLDPKHLLIISRSNNGLGWPIHEPYPDEFGMSIYRRVWTPVLNRYIEYPFPAWYYAFLAGIEKLWSGHGSMIHELQAEPWPPHGQSLTVTSLVEQNKSFNASDFRQTVSFTQATGMRTIYLWGSEYWYYRKVKLHDPSVWGTAKQLFRAANR